MRPRDPALRQRYVAAVAELQALGKPVTPRTLSDHLDKPYDAVRTFFNRNRDLASAIGVRINNHHPTTEYLSAKEKLLKEGVKPTARAIASEMGVDHSTVCRFFRRYTPSALEEKTTVIESLPTTRNDSLEPTVRSTMRITRELTVKQAPQGSRAVFNEEIETVEFQPPVKRTVAEPTWRSTVRTARELTVQHFDPRVLRVVLNKVTPEQYIQLWDKGHLHFQMKGLPKPDWMPTREEMNEFL